jgi:hypothetical protein
MKKSIILSQNNLIDINIDNLNSNKDEEAENEMNLKIKNLIKDKKNMYIETKTRNPELQNIFRKAIINRYKKCIISDMDEIVCEAAHIKSFTECNDEEKFNFNNGILLNSILHKLFDNYFITINPNSLNVEINNNCPMYKYLKKYENKYINKIKIYTDTINFLKIHYKQFQFLCNKKDI